MQCPAYTKQLPHYISNGDRKHMIKAHNGHAVDRNRRIMEAESAANKHTH